MRYKLFGKSGLRASELCLGTMTFGPNWGWGVENGRASLWGEVNDHRITIAQLVEEIS